MLAAQTGERRWIAPRTGRELLGRCQSRRNRQGHAVEKVATRKLVHGDSRASGSADAKHDKSLSATNQRRYKFEGRPIGGQGRPTRKRPGVV
jgi:hypothetical protein